MKPVVEKIRVFFTMVEHPIDGWIRVGKAYPTRDAAKEWIGFVRRHWRFCRVRISSCTLRRVNGELDERSRQVLDKKFNMDPPTLVMLRDALERLGAKFWPCDAHGNKVRRGTR